MGCDLCKTNNLDTETVKGTAVSLEGVDDIEGRDSLTLGVISVLCSVTDNANEEITEDLTNMVVNQVSDTLDTATACQTANSGLGDTLQVITGNLSVTLSATLAKTFTTSSFTRHL